MAKTTQLRTYTVRDGMLDEWVERWRKEVVPLRLELGFTIDGAWVDRERNQFIWLISYDGPETFPVDVPQPLPDVPHHTPLPAPEPPAGWDEEPQRSPAARRSSYRRGVSRTASAPSTATAPAGPLFRHRTVCLRSHARPAGETRLLPGVRRKQTTAATTGSAAGTSHGADAGEPVPGMPSWSTRKAAAQTA